MQGLRISLQKGISLLVTSSHCELEFLWIIELISELNLVFITEKFH